jgi:hypothetical protein
LKIFTAIREWNYERQRSAKTAAVFVPPARLQRTAFHGILHTISPKEGPMKNDKHQTAIPDTVLTQVHDQLAAILQLLQPYTVALTPHERQTLLKMGDKSLAFVEKTREYAHDNPNLGPGFVDMAAFDADYHDAHNLWAALALAQQLTAAIEDTTTAAGSDAYHTALTIYHNIQAAARNDVPGAQTIYEDLKTRFPGKKRRGGSEDGGPGGVV